MDRGVALTYHVTPWQRSGRYQTVAVITEHGPTTAKPQTIQSPSRAVVPVLALPECGRSSREAPDFPVHANAARRIIGSSRSKLGFGRCTTEMLIVNFVFGSPSMFPLTWGKPNPFLYVAFLRRAVVCLHTLLEGLLILLSLAYCGDASWHPRLPLSTEQSLLNHTHEVRGIS